MARRQKSKDAAIIESVTGLAALVLVFFFFSPGFRHYLEIVVGVLVFGLLVWLTCELIKQKKPSTTFRTFTSTPYQTDTPIRKTMPTVFVEPLQFMPEVRPSTISERLHKIDWFQFEKLVELIYRQQGFEVTRMGGANPDGGVDLVVKSSKEHFAIQCKQWRKWKVGVKDIREFVGALKDRNLQKGVFITLAGYSGEAKQLADRQEIQILNESDLVKMLESSGLMYSKEISALFADERKFCPKCEAEMVLKSNRKTGSKFWGCSTFPRCWSKLNLDA